MTTLVILRTHPGDPMLHGALERLRGLRLCVVADETRGQVALPEGIDKLALTPELPERLGLPSVPGWPWQCGDYALFAARARWPEARHFWMVESDLRLNMADPPAFLAGLEGCAADLLTTCYGRRGRGWYWYRRMARYRLPVLGSLFGLLRIAGPAIDALLVRRRAIAAQWRREGARPDRWPNDESVTASELTALGLDCRDLLEVAPGLYDPDAGYSVHWPVHESAPLLSSPDERVYHPVCDDRRFAARLERLIALSQRRRWRWWQETDRLGWREVELALGTVALSPDAAGTARRRDLVLPMLLRASAAPHMARRALAHAGTLLDPATPDALRHAAVRRIAVADAAPAGCEDFALGPRIAADVLSPVVASPYAADLAARVLCFVSTSPIKPLPKAGFSYRDQRAQAASLSRVPLDRLEEFLPEVTPAAPEPLLLHGAAEAMGPLLGASGIALFDAPGMFSQLGLGADPALLHHARRSPADAALALRATVRWLDRHAGASPGGIAVCLPALAPEAVAVLHRALPRARHLLLLRALEPWVRGHAQAGTVPAALAERLAAILQAAQALREAGADLRLLWWDEALADPGAALRLAGVETARPPLSPAPRPEPATPEADALWSRFAALWPAHRPAAAIAALDLPF